MLRQVKSIQMDLDTALVTCFLQRSTACNIYICCVETFLTLESVLIELKKPIRNDRWNSLSVSMHFLSAPNTKLLFCRCLTYCTLFFINILLSLEMKYQNQIVPNWLIKIKERHSSLRSQANELIKRSSVCH